MDFYLGNELSYDDTTNIAYAAYFSEIFAGEKYGQKESKIADQILGGNLDKIIIAHNCENFTVDVYGEVVGCYKYLVKQFGGSNGHRK
mgnify:FL=1